VQLVSESISKRWKYIKPHTGIPKKEFINMVNFLLDSTYFTFNNIIYKQNHGTPMGSPLSPIISGIVLQDLEGVILGFLGPKVKFYYRYVDDIIMASNKEDIPLIFEKFNNHHNRLKFTIETMNNNHISFLDLNIIVDNNSILLDWFQKKTSSGRVLFFFSHHPEKQKIGVILGLADRAILLSHPRYHQKNLYIDILLNNGYPLNLIFHHMKRRIKRLSYNIFHIKREK